MALCRIGSYAADIAIVRARMPAPLVIVVAGRAPAVAGLPFGYPASRLHGPYFAVGLRRVDEATRVAIIVADPLTGNAKGLTLPPEEILDAPYKEQREKPEIRRSSGATDSPLPLAVLESDCGCGERFLAALLLFVQIRPLSQPREATRCALPTG
jgi:ABC-type branched-subunit amino acid transport system permease subunit